MKNPNEIIVPVFKRGLNGYNSTEVDEFINGLKKDYDELYSAFTATEEKLRIVAAGLSEMKEKESEIESTIEEAKGISAALINQSKEHAEKTIALAEERAAEINEAMSASCKEILATYSEKYEDEKQHLVDMEKKAQEFRTSLLAAYKKQLGILCSTIPSNEKQDGEDDETLPDTEGYKADVTARFKDKVSKLGDTEKASASDETEDVDNAKTVAFKKVSETDK